MSSQDYVTRGLEQEAQVLQERIPSNMSKDNVDNVRDSLRYFLETNKISQAAFAKKIGVSSTQISQFLAAKYGGDLGELCNKVVNYINNYSRRKVVHDDKPQYVPTTVAKRIKTLVQNTIVFSDEFEGKIGVVIGDGGHGKSVCLRAYAEADANAIYILLDDSMNPLSMFVEIARRLATKQIKINLHSTMATLTRDIAEAISGRHLIFLLDEASGLKVKQLNMLRQIIVVKGACPLILSGNDALRATIMQDSTRQGCAALDQFRSRLMRIVNLDELAIEQGGDGGSQLYTEPDIKSMYEFGGVRLTRNAIETIRRICMTPGSGRLRTVSNLIQALHTSAEVMNTGNIDGPMLIEAAAYLGLPVRLPVLAKTKTDDHQQENDVAAAG